MQQCEGGMEAIHLQDFFPLPYIHMEQAALENCVQVN